MWSKRKAIQAKKNYGVAYTTRKSRIKALIAVIKNQTESLVAEQDKVTADNPNTKAVNQATNRLRKLEKRLASIS